jgi:hypothetical protein
MKLIAAMIVATSLFATPARAQTPPGHVTLTTVVRAVTDAQQMNLGAYVTVLIGEDRRSGSIRMLLGLEDIVVSPPRKA